MANMLNEEEKVRSSSNTFTSTHTCGLHCLYACVYVTQMCVYVDGTEKALSIFSMSRFFFLSPKMDNNIDQTCFSTDTFCVRKYRSIDWCICQANPNADTKVNGECEEESERRRVNGTAAVAHVCVSEIGKRLIWFKWWIWNGKVQISWVELKYIKRKFIA